MKSFGPHWGPLRVPCSLPRVEGVAGRDAKVVQQIRNGSFWKKGKDPHPQDKIQHLDLTKALRPLYYKTPPCAFYHKHVRSKAVFGP